MNIDTSFFDLLATGAVRAAQDPVITVRMTLAASMNMVASGSIIRNSTQNERSVYSQYEYTLRTEEETL